MKALQLYKEFVNPAIIIFAKLVLLVGLAWYLLGFQGLGQQSFLLGAWFLAVNEAVKVVVRVGEYAFGVRDLHGYKDRDVDDVLEDM